MNLHRLTLEHFRNIERQEIDFSNTVNIITGANAQGKTNLLEAIGYWAAARSHRTVHDDELIQTGQSGTYLKAEFTAQQRAQALEVTLLRNGQRRLTRNSVPLKTLRELVGTLPSVLFAPSDLGLVQEGPAVRRRLMDTVLCQLSPAYLSALSRYNKILKQKQKLLRRHGTVNTELLSVYNTQLAHYGAPLIAARARFVEQLSILAQAFHHSLSNGKESLTLHYKTVSAITDDHAESSVLEEQLNAHFAVRLPQEIACQFCLTGPQRDNFLLNINHNELKVFASQGQARTAAIAIKMAERAFFQQELGEPPLLLLDDVLSELDGNRRRVVLTALTEGQIFITCCDMRRTKTLGGHIIRVKDGTFR